VKKKKESENNKKFIGNSIKGNRKNIIKEDKIFIGRDS